MTKLVWLKYILTLNIKQLDVLAWAQVIFVRKIRVCETFKKPKKG